MRVLVPYDGGELSEQAAVMAMELLAHHGLEVVLLHAAPDERHAADTQASLDAVAARLGRSPDVIRAAMVVGRPDREIVRYAEHQSVDLIAMSTHGRPLLTRMLLGSVTDRVIRTSPVPVLILHPPTMSVDAVSPPAGRRLKILAPLDGSPMAEDAVGLVASLLRPERIDVTLVTNVSSPLLEGFAHDVFTEAATRLRERGVTVTTLVKHGEAADEIAKLAADEGFDLIAMSTHGRAMLARAILGSTTDRVVRISKVPVLVIQPRLMQTAHDPVSGEEIDPATAGYRSEYHGRTYWFTSFEHKQQFDGAPAAYVGREGPGAVGRTTVADGFADGADLANQPKAGPIPPV